MRNKILLPFFLLALLCAACKEKNVEPATSTETNQWIYDQMKYWYYWNDHITANPDLTQSPEDFFESLLYRYDAGTRPDGDRFSWIQESADELKASLSGETKTTGMQYKLFYYPSGSTNVIGVVLYVAPGSSASDAGFRRGDIFSSVGGTKLTGDNYRQLLNAGGALSYTISKFDVDDVLKETTVKRKVAPVVLQENPVFFDTTYTYDAHKIGYVVYHQFIPSPNGSSGKEYDQKLDDIFAKFKAAQVNALVLDLRYNPGGYVSSAINLASLITKGTTNDVFYYKEYNPQVTETNRKKYGDSYFYDKFVSKSQNISSSLQKLIVLTSSRTASASELLINGLKPFMDVTIIGEKTVGKNVGSVTITDSDGKIKWGMQPIVSKSLNSLKQSDYATGFVPNTTIGEGIILYPYGSPKDPLLGEALFEITGTHVTRMAHHTRILSEKGEEIESTIEKKAGGSNMFFDR
ncbi:S41 family peptidase [Dyadobacter sandarakinus]|uniref:Peptidase S41 n=1 Tax=Dyadobacter sandarakinus TaxID=2747268 RepID=A0ABX7IE83_9BACT|nr:S41 family peptidase [Dyadobacter sandarakinus]QRR03201.1 peptidase S41 [Dyadobacter sandarakinus]